MTKLHMVGGRTLEVTQVRSDISKKWRSEVMKEMNPVILDLVEIEPTHNKTEEHNLREISVNMSNVLYIS